MWGRQFRKVAIGSRTAGGWNHSIKTNKPVYYKTAHLAGGKTFEGKQVLRIEYRIYSYTHHQHSDAGSLSAG